MRSRAAGVLFRGLALVLLAFGPSIAAADTAMDVPPPLRSAIEKATYQIEPARKAGTNTLYVASSRAQGIRISFTSSGVLVSGASSGERWRLGMSLTSWGYGNKTRSVLPAKLAVSGDRIEYRRGPLAEWYSNSEAGLEQGFTVYAPPAAGHRSGTLRLRLALSGDLTPSFAEDGGDLLFARAGGERVLRFAGLKAFDAAGRPLPSRMELRGRELALLVDDTGAVYPVTVDPLLTRETKLTASDGWFGDQFGISVSVNGDTAVVGAPYDDDAGERSGSAYVFVRSAGVWSQQQKLAASDAAALDFFGWFVAVSGDTAVVGAPCDSFFGPPACSGSAYVFVRSAGVWSEQQKLTASDAAAGFGQSVAVSGDTAVVSAPAANAGSGFAYVFVRSGIAWSEQQKLTASDPEPGAGFGTSVSVSGDTAVVGAFGENGYSGSAYVFVRSGIAWSQQQKLTANDAAAGDWFGGFVAVSGDTAVVGAPRDDDAGDASGSAYVFVRSGTAWSQQQKLTASDAAAGDWFGSVAVSGDTAVVGAPCDPYAVDCSTSAYVFVRSAGGWSEQQKLTPSDAWPVCLRCDAFGFSVAVSGNTAVVGAPGNGSAYVYEPELTALSPARIWVGLKNSDAVGLRLDLLAEVFIDATKVGQGELDNVGGGSSGFNNALFNSIPLALTGGSVNAPSGAQLSIKVSARRTCSGGGHNSGTARLWYNGQPVDSGASRNAGSRFDATISGITSDYFLRSGSALSTTAGSSRTFADAFVNSSAPCPARPFTSFGTWSRTLP